MKSNRKTNGKVEILIAEDSPTQAAQLAHLLEQHGFWVTVARNGREALALLEQCKPTLIISDVLMPEMDGYGLCRAIKSDEKWKHVPIMLVTTLADAKDVIRGLECGADNFIRKPYGEKSLLSRVDYLLMNLELRKSQKMQMGVEISLAGQRHFISSERQQILDLLISTYEQAVQISDDLTAKEKELVQSNQVLRGLYRIAEGLNHAANEQEVGDLALERGLELPGIQAGWISLREGESGFRLAAARGLPPALEAQGAMEGECACRRRLLSGDLDSVTNILQCERLQKATGDTRGLLYHASVPLWLGDRTIGVMNLVGPEEGLFKEEELQVLYGIGNQLAVALERAHLREHLEQLVEERTARIARLSRIYAVLSGINTTIVRVRDRQQLFEEACRLAVEQGDFTFAWIGILDAGTQEVTPVARAGRDDGYLSQINLTAKADAQGNCELTARTFALGEPVVCNDIASDDCMKTWRAEALRRGYRSVALFPLSMEGQAIGVFVLYAPDAGVFDEEEMRLLVEMAGDISFALDTIRNKELLEQQTASLIAEIAERQRVQEAMQITESQLRTVLDNAPITIFATDGRGVFTLSEGKGLQLVGLKAGENVGTSALDLYGSFPFIEHSGNVLDGGEVVRRVLAGESVSALTELRGRYFDNHISPLMGADGMVHGIVGVAIDITERKHAEQALERLATIIEATPDFVATSDPGGRVLYCNQAGLRMLGHEPGHDTSTLDVRGSHPEWAAKLVMETGIPYAIAHGSWIGETAFLRTDGQEIPIAQVILAHRGADGSVDYLSTIAHDMTSRKLAEEEHRRMERKIEQVQRVNSLGRVAATIAHEFNNVLMGIQPFAEIIRRLGGDDERISKAAEHISNSVRRGKRVTEEILRFTNAVAPVLDVIDLEDWLAQLAPELQGIAGNAVRMTIAGLGRSVFVRCDSAQLQQVVSNLVINARDAMGGTGAIAVSLTDNGSGAASFAVPQGERLVRLTVRDDGCGIPPEMLDQIFEPLFTTKRSGTGLGLAVARQVVAQHGGFIHAENAPGGGAAFHVLLPQVGKSSSVVVPAVKASGRLRRLLLVEDERAVSEGLCSLLESEQIMVRVVERGAEVVSAIEAFRPEVVILDLTLPDIDGHEVFARITEKWPDLAVVFSTGHGGEAELSGELSRAHVGFLRKPYVVDVLLDAIERVL